MNVLIAADFSSPVSENFIPSLIAVSRKISEVGGKVVFAFPEYRSWIDWIRHEGFAVEIVGKQIALNSEEAFSILLSIIEKYDISILYIHFNLFLDTVLENRDNLKNIVVIMHDHMDYTLAHSNFMLFLYHAYLSLVFRKKRINIITVMRRKYRSYLFANKKWFVPNALSYERNVCKSLSRDEFRNMHGILGNEKLCFILGWNIQIKGVDVALKSVAKCREEDSSIILGVIGLSNPERVKQLAEITGINIEKETWVRVFDSQEDMFAVHRAVDCYISSSRRDAFSYGLLEAISQDSPIVISDIPGTMWASEYSNAHVFRSEDVNDCSNKIKQALETGRVKTNKEAILSRHKIEDWVLRIVEILHYCEAHNTR